MFDLIVPFCEKTFQNWFVRRETWKLKLYLFNLPSLEMVATEVSRLEWHWLVNTGTAPYHMGAIIFSSFVGWHNTHTTYATLIDNTDDCSTVQQQRLCENLNVRQIDHLNGQGARDAAAAKKRKYIPSEAWSDLGLHCFGRRAYVKVYFTSEKNFWNSFENLGKTKMGNKRGGVRV